MRTCEPRGSRVNKTQCRLRLLTLRIGLAGGFLAFISTAQADVIFSESFETDGQGVRYTASQPFNVQQSSNGAYWDRGVNDDFNTLAPYTNPDGTFFWAAESVDWTNPGPGGNGNEVQTIDFGPFNIEGFTNLQFSGLFASTAPVLGVGFPFDPGQGIRVKYSVDSLPFSDGLCFTAVNWPTLRNLGHDTDCNGSGEGAVLTADFSGATNPFTFNIPDGTRLEIHVEVEAPEASQEVALDLLQVSGDFASIPGDTNADGFVNIIDLNNVRNNFGATGPNDGTLPGDAFPFDGFVNIIDLNGVRNNFGAGTTAVPEPSTLALASLFAFVAVIARRRRS